MQRETREKLELFPKLGYYFVVFRAIESQKSRQRRLLTDLSVNPSLTESSIIAEVSVYLVVFREGIVSVSRVKFTTWFIANALAVPF